LPPEESNLFDFHNSNKKTRATTGAALVFLFTFTDV